MRATSRRVRFYLRIQLPALLVILCSLASYLNFGIAPSPSLKPLTTLIFLFYWACYWPRLLHPAIIFAVGLLEDLLSGYPVGISPLLYLLIYGLIISQRRLILKEPFPVVWGIFAISSLFYMLAAKIAFRLLGGQPLMQMAPIVQWLATVMVYPFLHQLCIFVQQYLARIRPVSGRRSSR